MRRFTETLDGYPDPDRQQILDAARWANRYHAGQLRASGEPFIVHPLAVAATLVDSRLDRSAVIAALTHDVVEDTAATMADLEQAFGEEVRSLVEGVTKISVIKGMSRTVRQAESIRKMLFAMVRDIRVILIKLADKSHNMRTLEHHTPAARRRIAAECLEIYCPLAGHLGMYRLRTELEDLSLKHLQPEAYDQIRQVVAQSRSERESQLGAARSRLQAAADQAGLAVQIEARAKHFYSVFRKMRDRATPVDSVLDLLGIRVLCEETGTCYELLGLVHQLWPPVAGRFKDYIAMPKANRYQSLHTTVMTEQGRPLEVQIRTVAMHQTAEVGVAAHLRYKDRSSGRGGPEPAIIARLREWQGDSTSADDQPGSARSAAGAGGADLLAEIKSELLHDSIYVFTPKGQIIELPAGATPIDFAYRIHTDVGHHCQGAKSNGVIMPLSSPLQSTNVVEILTSPRAHPHVGWLQHARTSKAHAKIRQWLAQHEPGLVVEGDLVAKAPALAPSPPRRSPRRRAARRAEPARTRIAPRQGDEPGLLIRTARCCRPQSGDPIVGYVSRGRGITVHRAQCANVANIRDFAERRVEVVWQNADRRPTFQLEVSALPDARLFSAIERAIGKEDGVRLSGSVADPSATVGEEERVRASFAVQIGGEKQLARLLKALRRLPAVREVDALPTEASVGYPVSSAGAVAAEATAARPPPVVGISSSSRYMAESRL